MNSHIPSEAKDAIRTLAEFADQNRYAEVTVSRTGSASFTQRSYKEKKESFGVVSILATIAAMALFISSLVILGINLFKPFPELTERSWILILIGTSVLSAMVTIEPAIGKREMRDTSIVMATFAAFLFSGLALLSSSLMLSTLFYSMAFCSFVFGSGFNILQRGMAQIQQSIKRRDKAV